MATVQDVRLDDGRTIRVHDTGPAAGARLTIVWHHGSPQTGAPLEPVAAAAAERGIRLVSYGRPSYGGSTPFRGRDVASAAGDVGRLADELDLGPFAVMGASGGGPHALACAALLPGRVIGVACFASLAPYDPLDGAWFDGMADEGALRAALAGQHARERFEELAEFDPSSFNERDYAALAGPWAALGDDVGIASADGTEGLVDDDLAFAAPWGFAVSEVSPPVLLVQGGEDRVVPPHHADLLLRELADRELWFRPADGHIAVLLAVPLAMDWLLEHAASL